MPRLKAKISSLKFMIHIFYSCQYFKHVFVSKMLVFHVNVISCNKYVGNHFYIFLAADRSISDSVGDAKEGLVVSCADTIETYRTHVSILFKFQITYPMFKNRLIRLQLWKS